MLIKTCFFEEITNIDINKNLTDIAGDFSLTEIKNFISGIATAKIQLKQNANPRLVLEILMLDMPKRKRERVRG